MHGMKVPTKFLEESHGTAVRLRIVTQYFAFKLCTTKVRRYNEGRMDSSSTSPRPVPCVRLSWSVVGAEKTEQKIRPKKKTLYFHRINRPGENVPFRRCMNSSNRHQWKWDFFDLNMEPEMSGECGEVSVFYTVLYENLVKCQQTERITPEILNNRNDD